MTATYRVKTPIYYPKPGVAVKPGERCAPEDEMAPAVGSLVDLGHLSPVAVGFFLANDCIESVPDPAGSKTSTSTRNTTDEGGN